MKSKKGQLMYEGKAKRVFHADQDDRVWVEFKNDATAFNAKKHQNIEGKGRLNCKISASIFEFLEKQGVPTHYLSQQSDCWLLVQRVEIIPLEVVIRNIATGSLCRETPIQEGSELSPPLLDFYFKDDSMGDPLLSENRLSRLNLISSEQKGEIEVLAYRVNTLLKGFFEELQLKLVDFKLEFGINNQGQILVADEISPDTCRIWDQKTDDPNDRVLDKDRFRRDLGGLIDGYGEVLKRIQGNTTKPLNCS